MKVYRNIVIRNVMVLFTGLLFLNMSFFMAEVKALKLDKDKALLANIVKLIAGSLTEEEKEGCGSAGESGAFVKEIDLLYAHLLYLENNHLLTLKKAICFQGTEKLLTRSNDTVTPPPKA